MKRLLSFVLCAFLILSKSTAQNFEEYGLPFVQNYTDKDFVVGSQQNWAIVQDPRGIMYFGNNNGILEYDGFNWRMIEVDNNTNVRSLAIDKKGVIFVGAQSDFGYLTADSKGMLKYNSLASLLKEEEKDFEDIWKTYATDQGIYFQSYKRLFRYKDGKIKSWSATPTFHFSFIVNDTLYIRQREKGFLKLVGDNLQYCKGTSMFASPRTNFILNYDKGRKLFGTLSDGLFIGYFDNKADSMVIEPFKTEIDQELSQTEVYQGIKVGEDKFLIGTLSSGAFLIDKNGKLLAKFNKAGNLLDDKILFVTELNKSFWFATNKGISHVEFNSPLTRYDEKLGLVGKLYDVIRIKEKILAATSQGVYYTYKEKYHTEFKQLPGVNVQCWDIIEIDEENILVGFGNGILKINIKDIENPEIEQLTQQQCYVLYRSPSDKNTIYAGTINGLQKVNLSSKNIEVEDVLPEDIQSTIKNICEDKDGSLWLGSTYEGVFHISKKHEHYHLSAYDTTSGIPSQIGNLFETFNGKTILVTVKGIYKFVNKGKIKFEYDDVLTKMLIGKPQQIMLMNPDHKGNYYIQMLDVTEQDDKGIAFKISAGKYKWDPVPLRRIPRSTIYTIYPEKNGIVWLGNSDGLYRYDENYNKNYNAGFNAFIRSVTATSDTIIDGKAVPKKDLIFFGTYFSQQDNFTLFELKQGKDFIPRIEYSKNTIRFDFSAPFFEEEEAVEYQYMLEGYSEVWSEWTKKTDKEYTKLNNGGYTFKVKARNIYGVESPVAEYQFVILPPWYKTYWAYALYVLMVIAAIYGIVQASVYRLKAAKDRLEKIVKERTTEVVKQKDEIEKQAHLLEDKNKEITDSIFYAKKIQEAILVSTDVISKAISNSFILFKPKDIVSGDFYFYNRLNKNEGPLHVLASADCTGHGVPGAFMSMIGNDKLNEAVKVFSDPGRILQYLNNLIKEALQKEDNANSAKDGMDIALCVIDPVHRKLKYSGANRPLWIIRNNSNELEEVKATKTAIGGFTEYDHVYDSHELTFNEGDTVYFFTDGYADQFGGELGKKMMTKKFKEKLFEIKALSLPEQKQILDDFYMAWKGEYEQVDDVLVIGVRF